MISKIKTTDLLFTPTIMLLASSTLLLADPVAWDGNTDSNASGAWDVAANWSPDGVVESDDEITLGDVTAGTRVATVTSGNPQTVQSLSMMQSTAGAVNTLTLDDDLTVTNASGDPLSFTSTAGQGAILVNVADGVTLTATRTIEDLTADLDGSFNLGTGSGIHMTADDGESEVTFNGPVDAGTNASIHLSGLSSRLSLNGDSNFASGSTIKLSNLYSQGDAILSNAGNLVMDGATLEFGFDSDSANNASTGRNFQNTGTWTFKEGASAIITSSTGLATNGGYGVTIGSQNSGTLNIESGSSITNRIFYNTGTVNLGSNTVGVSDAEVTFGNEIGSQIEFHNGRTATGTAGVATLNVLGNATLGRTTSSNTIALNNGSSTSTGSTINIGDGTTEVVFKLQNRAVSWTNYAGNTVNLKSNSTTLLKSLHTASDAAGEVVLMNAGTLVHSGSLQFQGQKSGARTFSTSSTGTYQINGTEATLENLENPAGSTGFTLQVNYSNAGILTGATASDKLTYVNSSGQSGSDILALNHTGGTVTPGAGSNGSGSTSVGALELTNVDLSLSGATTMEFDLGGTVGSGLFDSLVLSGAGGTLDLGTDSILNISTVNGFAAETDQVYTIVGAGAVMGTFASLLFNDAAWANEYTVNYLSDGIEITLFAIPEPSTYALWAGLLIGVVCGARRRRSSRE